VLKKEWNVTKKRHVHFTHLEGCGGDDITVGAHCRSVGFE
jgi:hypothetical protein